ncbi:cysteine hydrolase family protein [Oceanobacillus bengalensis]|uniref:Isochorismatase family protein n=1 Tax=Oceanobacillus bengalensis TaxID=1435466 RepID=A0A494YZC2_9BACI|nr:isochorismatase family protein [Oceanobacillus bengalensis]RKQ15072.1 isochorismatase family protein [Oceanobacillus bengalensis]
MKALLVIDAQNTIIHSGDFTKEISTIEEIIQDFKGKGEPVIFVRNIDNNEDSPFYKNADTSELHHSLKDYADHITLKKTPSSFYQTDLSTTLEKLGVNHVFITGFNTEFCCMFTAIAAFDRGYKVTFIEDATGTVNDEDTYEMKGLDIRDFVGTALHWSNVIQVLDYEEYEEGYKVTN